jgi:hypothetical protein
MAKDIVEGVPEIPQTLNRYPYVINNPKTLTDPTGEILDWLKEFWDKLTQNTKTAKDSQKKIEFDDPIITPAIDTSLSITDPGNPDNNLDKLAQLAAEVSEKLHKFFDLAGYVPIPLVSVPAEGIGGLLYLSEGENEKATGSFGNAALSLFPIGKYRKFINAKQNNQSAGKGYTSIRQNKLRRLMGLKRVNSIEKLSLSY